MNNIKERIKIFSGAQLKYIAFLSMLIDHTNKALIYPNLDGGALNRLSDFFDILGRIAFPIFIFLLVEGYFHTKNKWKYLITLLVFGVISEIPFDMCTTATFFEVNWNNIMFTLALVLAMIWLIDVLKEKMAALPKALWYFVSFLIATVLCFAAIMNTMRCWLDISIIFFMTDRHLRFHFPIFPYLKNRGLCLDLVWHLLIMENVENRISGLIIFFIQYICWF